MDLLAEEELNVGMVVFCMDEQDVTRIIAHPTVSVITDGLLGGKPHPLASTALSPASSAATSGSKACSGSRRRCAR